MRGLPTAGDLRHRVEWRERVDSVPGPGSDSFGQGEPGYSSRGTYYARVEPLRGADLVAAKQLASVRYLRVWMRYVGPVKALDQLIFQGRTLTVESAFRIDEVGDWLQIDATESAGTAPNGP